MRRINIRTSVCITIFLIGLVICLSSGITTAGDYINYYYGSYFLKEGSFTSAIYEPIDFNLMVKKHFPNPSFGNYTPIPPITSLFFFPFAFLPFFLSKVVFGLAGLTIFCISLYRLLNHLCIRSIYLLTIPFIFTIPIISNLEQGQLYLLITALLIEGYLSDYNKKSAWAASFFGLAISLKIFPIIVLLYLLINKSWKTFLLTILFTAVFSLLPIIAIDQGILTEYYTRIIPRLFTGEINDPFATSYQSMSVVLKKIFVYDKLLNSSGLLHWPLAYSLLNTLYSLLIFTTTILVLKSKNEGWSRFSMVIFAGILTSGYGTTYSLILLIPISIVLIAQTPENRLSLILLAAGMLPISWLSEMSIYLRFLRLWLLLAVFIYIVYKTKPRLIYFLALYPVMLCCIYIYTLTGNYKPGLSNQVLNHQKHLLLYDFELTNDSLHLSYYTCDGPMNEKVFFACKDKNKIPLTISSNQVVLNGRKITNTDSRKKKAVLLKNEKKIIYMSDEGRGVGFYTLRYLNL